MDPISLMFAEDTIPSSDSLFQIPFYPNFSDPLSITPTQLPFAERLQILEHDDDLRNLVDQTTTDYILQTHDMNPENFLVSSAAESSSSQKEQLGPPGACGEQISNQAPGGDRIANPSSTHYGGEAEEEENNLEQELSTKKVRLPKSKIVHREIERKRRSEMTSLQQSLRSHLPSEYLKGRRSISDQLNEAARYIRHLQAKTKALKQKRNELLSLPQPNSYSSSSSSYSNNTPEPASYYGHPQDHHHHGIRNIGDNQSYASRPNSEMEMDRAKVNITSWTIGGGVKILEVVVSSCIAGESWALSRVIRCLESEGVDVVCSTSSKVNGKWLHFLRAEVTIVDKFNLT